MNILMILSLVGLWVSGFCFGMVLERQKQRNRGKVVLHMDISKEDVKKMVDDAVVEIKARCMPKKAVETMIKRMQLDVCKMEYDRMTGDTPLIRRKEVIIMLGNYLEEINEKGAENDKNSL